VAKQVKDPVVRSFWQNEFSKYVYQNQGQALSPLLNKMGAFLTTPLVRNMVGREECAIDFREVLDQGKILLVNLAQGKIGEDVSSFLGSLLVTKLYLAALSRIEVPERKRRDFYLYVDEFQNFVASESFDSILSEARKYRLSLILAHQYIGQLSEKLRLAIFGNAGTLAVFAVGPEDAEYLENEFRPRFDRYDLIGQDKYHAYIKLAIEGKTSEPFSARTLPPFYAFEPQGNREKVIFLSRRSYAQGKA